MSDELATFNIGEGERVRLIVVDADGWPRRECVNGRDGRFTLSHEGGPDA